MTGEEGVGAPERDVLGPYSPASSHPRPGLAHRSLSQGGCRRPWPHLLRGLPDALAHGFRVALLFLQLLLELCDPGL